MNHVWNRHDPGLSQIPGGYFNLVEYQGQYFGLYLETFHFTTHARIQALAITDLRLGHMSTDGNPEPKGVTFVTSIQRT